MSSHSWKQINSQDINKIASLGPPRTNVVTDISYVNSTSTLTLIRDTDNDLTTVIPGRVPSEFVGWYAYQSGGSTTINNVTDFPFETTRMNYESMFHSNTRATIPTGLGGKWVIGFNVICSGLTGTYKIIQFTGSNGYPLAYSHLSSTTASISAHGVYNCSEGTIIRITNGSGAALTFTGSVDVIGSYFYGYRISE